MPALNGRQRDRLLAVVTAVFAVSYVAAARGIEDSLLSDAVGAGGVPQGVGIAMGVTAVALFVKSFIGSDIQAEASSEPPLASVLLRAGGLVALLLGYGLLLPWLGYPLTVSLLVGAAGRLAGAPLKLPLLACAVAAGPVLWAVFDFVLKVRMPIGSLWGQ